MASGNAIVKVTKQGLKFLSKNSNIILTVVSAAGVLMTVTFAVKGTIKAVKLYEEVKPVGKKEIVKTVWRCYIPTIGFVILTTTAILCNGHMNAKRFAVMTSALSASTEAAKRLESSITENIGPKKAQEIIDEAHSKSAEKYLASGNVDIIDTGNGNEIFFLEDVGQMIRTDVTHIELAEAKTEDDLQDSNDWDENGDNIIMLNAPLERLGARECWIGRTHGWRQAELKKLGLKGPKFRISSKRMTVNGENRAVGTVWFEPEPEPI